MDVKCFDKLIERNYKTLVRFGLAITRSEENARVLINETYIDILDRAKEPPMQTNEDFKRWMYNYMKLLSLAKYGSYQKAIHGKELLKETLPELPETQSISNNEMLCKVQRFKLQLDALDTILFELIYEKQMSCSKIAKLYNINKRSVQLLSRQLRIKINTL